MAQASSATGVPLAVLRIAKRSGCAAFKSNRVDVGLFIRWWFSNRVEDLSLERARAEKMQHQTALLKLERARVENSLVDIQEAEKLIAEYFTIPIRSALLSLPANLDTLCNPGDPQLARDALTRWVDETMRIIREKIPQP